MKLNKFFLMGAIIIGMVACTNDDVPGSSDNGKDETVWASFAIALPDGSGTRAGVDGSDNGDTYAGTTDEQAVGAVRVVLYDADIVAYSWDMNITADGTAAFTGTDVASGGSITPATKSRFVSVARKVAKKDYKVLVMLNPTDAAKSVTNDGNTLSSFTAAVSTTPTGVMTGNKIFMCNEQGLVPVTAATNLKSDAATAAQNPVAVNVDRILVKIFVGEKSGGVTTATGDAVSGLQWTPNVTNKKTFWMRQMGNLSTGVAEVLGNGSSRLTRYAVDPNFNGSPSFATGSANDYGSEFNYKTTAQVTADLGALGFDDDAKGKYVLENTMAAAEQYEVATTQVILKAVYTPSGVSPAGSDWASYKGYALPLSTFQAKVTAAQQTGATDASVGMPTGFVAEILALGATPLDYTNSFVNGNIKFYKGGVCYYTVLIRHFDDTLAPWNGSLPYVYGRYGVVRNNIYKITLNSIKRPGEPTVTDPTSANPDDEMESYVSFDVTVMPWLVRTQQVDL